MCGVYLCIVLFSLLTAGRSCTSAEEICLTTSALTAVSNLLQSLQIAPLPICVSFSRSLLAKEPPIVRPAVQIAVERRSIQSAVRNAAFICAKIDVCGSILLLDY